MTGTDTFRKVPGNVSEDELEGSSNEPHPMTVATSPAYSSSDKQLMTSHL